MRARGLLCGLAFATGVAVPAFAQPTSDVTPTKPAPLPGACLDFPVSRLPALPAGCAVPSLADCKSERRYLIDANNAVRPQSDCVKVQAEYCKKQYVADYCADPGSEWMIFPGGNPKASFDFIPPGKEARGKQSPYVGLTQPQGGAIVVRNPHPLSFSVGATGATVRATGRGSYGSTILPSLVGHTGAGAATMGAAHTAKLTNRTVGTNLTALFGPENGWVGDGSDTPDHRRVSSCEEYVYQRWYDYERYRFAAARFGRNYRGMYSAAVDPSSPVFLDKPTLSAFGYGTTPKQLENASIPRNVFIGVYPDWLDHRDDVPAATVTAIKARLAPFYRTGTLGQTFPVNIELPGPRTKLELHKRMKSLMDTKYGNPPDDAFDELGGRMKIYSELLAQRSLIMWQIACKLGACDPRVPTYGPAPIGHGVGTGGIRDIIGNGGIVPGVRPGGPGPTDGPGDVSRTARFASQMMTGMSRYNATQSTLQLQASHVMFRRVAATHPHYVVHPGPRLGNLGRDVRPITDRDILRDIEDKLTKLLVAEWNLGDKGCLEDPRGQLGNRCDWSYELFAHETLTAFEKDEESDFAECSEAVGGNFRVMRDPPSQQHIYPCAAREDFARDQGHAHDYLVAAQQEPQRRTCEAEKLNASVKEYLASQASKVAAIPLYQGGIGNESHDHWQLGDAGSLGLHAQYSVDWGIKGKTRSPSEPWCEIRGSAGGAANAGVDFFGSKLELFNASARGSIDNEKGPQYQVHLDYEDMTTLPFSRKTLVDVPLTQVPVPVSKPLLDPPKLIGEVKRDWWIAVGPIPIHIQAGANAMTGIDFSLNGAQGVTCASTANTTGYKLSSVFSPYVRADMFADGSVDVGVASAGVRLDLMLLKIALPITAAVDATIPQKVGFNVKGELGIDALAGRLSAYAEIDYVVGSKTWETTIVAWDGVHANHPLFEFPGYFDLEVLTFSANPSPFNASNVSCRVNPNPGALGRPMCSPILPGGNDGCDPARPTPTPYCRPFFPTTVGGTPIHVVPPRIGGVR